MLDRNLIYLSSDVVASFNFWLMFPDRPLRKAPFDPVCILARGIICPHGTTISPIGLMRISPFLGGKYRTWAAVASFFTALGHRSRVARKLTSPKAAPPSALRPPESAAPGSTTHLCARARRRTHASIQIEGRLHSRRICAGIDSRRF